MELLGKVLLGVLLLGCQVAKSTPHAGASQSDEQEYSVPSKEWHELLSCGLIKTQECREKLESARNSPDLELSSLAKVLLEEWRLAETSEELSTPRPVKAYVPDWNAIAKDGEGLVEWFVFVATISVGPEGFAEDVDVIRSSGDEVLDGELAADLLGIKFRPAMKDSQYVPGELQISLSPDFL